MKCPNCATKMVHDTREVVHTYKGETTTYEATGNFCDACDEVVFDRDEAPRVSALIVEFNKQVNAISVDPIFITRVRKKLKLDQRQAGELFGGGVNAFSRYETGKTKPPLALVRLFNILERHPELLAEAIAEPQDP